MYKRPACLKGIKIPEVPKVSADAFADAAKQIVT